ncbi:MAG: NAD(P)/FAD-dependent oxidoreductase [Spirochaetes bacterium]|nr:NAD(P)/FAD-dependent oxidoreductase [Spirochaetota bacterium]
MRAAVIGSGLSGLCAAALLAKEGHQVTLFEQHERIGGVTAGIEKDGFRWDYGQLLFNDFGPGEAAYRVLEKLGIAGKVKTVAGYREYGFPDFFIERPGEYGGIYWRRERLKELFPGEARGLDRYYRLYDRIHDLVGLSGKTGLLARMRLMLAFLPVMRMKNWSARRLMEYYFADPKLRAVFTSILADYVARPEDFPGLIIPIINAEAQYDERVPLDYGGHQHRSSWRFVVGGCRELVEAIAGVIRHEGGRILTGTAVGSVSVKGGRVDAVVTEGGDRLEVDAVVASGGAQELFGRLVGREHLPEDFMRDHVENIAVTESAFMVHLGVDYDPSVHQNGAALKYHYLTYDIDGAIEECERGVYHEGKDGFLVHIPSKYSPSMAPPGHHAVTVYTIAPDSPVNGTWKEDGERWAERLLEIAERQVPGLRRHERTRVVVTPEDFRRRTYLDHHAFGGATPRLDRTPPAHRTPIGGLWLVGAQSETFGGVAGTLTGSDNAVRMMLTGGGAKVKDSFKNLTKE